MCRDVLGGIGGRGGLLAVGVGVGIRGVGR